MFLWLFLYDNFTMHKGSMGTQQGVLMSRADFGCGHQHHSSINRVIWRVSAFRAVEVEVEVEVH